MPIICAVCSGRQDGGSHYGAIICNGCRGFFKRQVRQLRSRGIAVTKPNVKTYLKCAKKPSCSQPLNAVNRIKCAQHRLLGCLRANLNPDCVESRAEPPSAAPLQMTSLPSGDSSLLSHHAPDHTVRLYRRASRADSRVVDGFRVQYSSPSSSAMDTDNAWDYSGHHSTAHPASSLVGASLGTQLYHGVSPSSTSVRLGHSVSQDSELVPLVASAGFTRWGLPASVQSLSHILPQASSAGRTFLYHQSSYVDYDIHQHLPPISHPQPAVPQHVFSQTNHQQHHRRSFDSIGSSVSGFLPMTAGQDNNQRHGTHADETLLSVAALISSQSPRRTSQGGLPPQLPMRTRSHSPHPRPSPSQGMCETLRQVSLGASSHPHTDSTGNAEASGGEESRRILHMRRHLQSLSKDASEGPSLVVVGGNDDRRDNTRQVPAPQVPQEPHSHRFWRPFDLTSKETAS